MVRSTVLTKSMPSLPWNMPAHIALKVAIGDGSSTGSTMRIQVANDHTASSTATPTSGSRTCRRFQFIASPLAHFALEDFQAMRLDVDELGFGHGLVGARPRRIVMHELDRTRRMARQQQDAVRQVHRLLEVVRHQHRGG